MHILICILTYLLRYIHTYIIYIHKYIHTKKNCEYALHEMTSICISDICVYMNIVVWTSKNLTSYNHSTVDGCLK